MVNPIKSGKIREYRAGIASLGRRISVLPPSQFYLAILDHQQKGTFPVPSRLGSSGTVPIRGEGGGGGGEKLAATFDLAAFRKDMIAPVKKSVNHSKTVTSMGEMRLEGAKRIRI